TQCHEQVKIVIEDDGPGIPESQRDKVFQSFYKAKASNIASKGFGLGLAIVSRIVQMHQGHIRIGQSSLGGCKFIITLPTK
ncbi:MAG: ATP-binding protein, partial [Gammaproteobacteria bacterium]